MNSSIKISLNKERIIVISDIHGHLDLLKKLLDQVSLEPEDVLIILGDFLNRGINSYGTLKAIEKLSQRKNTYILKGNHEFFIESIMATYDAFEVFESYLRNGFYENIIQSMMHFKGVAFDDFESLEEVYDYLKTTFKDDFLFIESLPIAMEEANHLFIHGGYDDSFSESDVVKFLKYDDFNTLSKVNEKQVVVGHWPCSNLRQDRIDNRPFFNKDKHIIFIDGGLGVKESGELNGLIIKKIEDTYDYDFLQVNHYDKYEVIKTHDFDQEETVYINYPDYDIKITKRGPVFSQGLHIKTGKTFRIFNDLIKTTDQGDYLMMNYVNCFLNLEVHTQVNLVLTIKEWALVKHQNTFGWLMKDQITQVTNKEMY